MGRLIGIGYAPAKRAPLDERQDGVIGNTSTDASGTESKWQ